MLNRVELPNDDLPDDVMEGRCPVCGSVVQCLRRETEMREWFGQQLPCASCPKPMFQGTISERPCGARVHVSRRRS